jgi:hypothetical protein
MEQRAAFKTELSHFAGGGAGKTERQLPSENNNSSVHPAQTGRINLTSQLQVTLWTEGPNKTQKLVT